MAKRATIATNSAAWKAASDYVNKQIETMKKFGSAPKLSSKDREALVRKVAEASAQ